MEIKNNKPSDVLNIFMNSIHNGDIETAKNILSEGSLKKLKSNSSKESDPFNLSLRAFLAAHYVSFSNVTREVIQGNMAFIEVTNPNKLINNSFCFALCKENTVWKMALDCQVLAIVEVEDEKLVKRIFNYLKGIFRNGLRKLKTKG